MYIFLHIGFEKTGSTAFQSAWWGTAQHNLHNAQFSSHPSFLQHLPYGLTTFICPERQLGGLKRPPSSFLPDLLEYLRVNSESHVLLTDEHISSRLLEQTELRALESILKSAGHELIVLAVTRERDEWLRSKYSQAVKGGYVGTFQHYVRSGGSRHTAELDVQRTLSVWRDLGNRVIELEHNDEVVSQILTILAEITGRELTIAQTSLDQNIRLSSWHESALLKVNRIFARIAVLRKVCKWIILKF